MAITQTQKANFNGSNYEKIATVLGGLGNEWVEQGLVKIHTKVPTGKGVYLNKMTVGAGSSIVANNPDGVALADSITSELSARQLTTVSCATKKTFTPQEWKDNFPDFQPEGPSNHLTLDPVVMDSALSLIMNKISSDYSHAMSVWEAANPGELFDGFIPVMLADADTIKVANQGLIDSSNAIDILRATIDAVPKRLRKAGKALTAVYNYNTQLAIMDANENTHQSGVIMNQSTPSMYRGTSLKVIDSIPDDVILITYMSSGDDSNLHLGTWVANEESSFVIAKPNELHQNYSLVARYDFGVQYCVSEDIVIYQGAL